MAWCVHFGLIINWKIVSIELEFHLLEEFVYLLSWWFCLIYFSDISNEHTWSALIEYKLYWYQILAFYVITHSQSWKRLNVKQKIHFLNFRFFRLAIGSASTSVSIDGCAWMEPGNFMIAVRRWVWSLYFVSLLVKFCVRLTWGTMQSRQNRASSTLLFANCFPSARPSIGFYSSITSCDDSL